MGCWRGDLDWEGGGLDRDGCGKRWKGLKGL